MPEQFEIILSKQSAKYYKKLSIDEARRLDRAFLLLEKDPLGSGDIQLLSVKPKRYRFRVGGLRIIYQIDTKKKLVLVSTILPRGQIYRTL